MVPGHVELVNVLWELGVLPDVRVLPRHTGMPIVPASTREAAIVGAMTRFGGDHWTYWPLGLSWHNVSAASLFNKLQPDEFADLVV